MEQQEAVETIGRPLGVGRSSPIRVLLVDDQTLLRTGTALVLGAHDDLVVVGEASNGADAVAATLRLRPDVVVMDVRMPGMDGIEATERIVAQVPSTRVLVLTTFDLDEVAIASLAAGASGFLLKECGSEELVAAVRAVAVGNAVVAPRAAASLLRSVRSTLRRAPAEPPHDLSPRELAIVRCIARGLSNLEIGRELFISESTVKTHVASILRKTGLRDRVHIAILAFRSGLVAA